MGLIVLNTDNQIHDKVKTQKLFDTYKLTGKWKHVGVSFPCYYEALDDGATIELCMTKIDLIEPFSFKKYSKIIIKDSIMEFYEEDLF